MAAPFYGRWKNVLSLQEKPMSTNSRLGGGGYFGLFGGGGKCRFYFYGREIFLNGHPLVSRSARAASLK